MALPTAKDEEAGAISRLLVLDDLDRVAQRLTLALQDAGGKPGAREEIVLCQLALLMGEDLPIPLREQLPLLASSAEPTVADLAHKVLEARAAGTGEGFHAVEKAAYLLMWLERDQPSLVSRYLLLLAVSSLDGSEVSERLAATLVHADEESTPLVHLLRARHAALRRSWAEVAEHAMVCIETGGWVGRQAMPLWLDALTERGDRQASLASLSELPESLRNFQSDALHAGLLWQQGDHEGAAVLWSRAIGAGWTESDSTFTQALPSVDLEPAELLVVATCESRVHRDKVALACRPDLPSEVLEALLALEDSDVHAALAANPSVPEQSLQRLARLGVFEAIEVAGNVAATSELLAELADRPEASVRRAVASSPRCPVAVLERLALDSETVVLMAVRDNPSSPDALRVHVALML